MATPPKRKRIYTEEQKAERREKRKKRDAEEKERQKAEQAKAEALKAKKAQRKEKLRFYKRQQRTRDNAKTKMTHDESPAASGTPMDSVYEDAMLDPENFDPSGMSEAERLAFMETLRLQDNNESRERIEGSRTTQQGMRSITHITQHGMRSVTQMRSNASAESARLSANRNRRTSLLVKVASASASAKKAANPNPREPVLPFAHPLGALNADSPGTPGSDKEILMSEQKMPGRKDPPKGPALKNKPAAKVVPALNDKPGPNVPAPRTNTPVSASITSNGFVFNAAMGGGVFAASSAGMHGGADSALLADAADNTTFNSTPEDATADKAAVADRSAETSGSSNKSKSINGKRKARTTTMPTRRSVRLRTKHVDVAAAAERNHLDSVIQEVAAACEDDDEPQPESWTCPKCGLVNPYENTRCGNNTIEPELHAGPKVWTGPLLSAPSSQRCQKCTLVLVDGACPLCK